MLKYFDLEFPFLYLNNSLRKEKAPSEFYLTVIRSLVCILLTLYLIIAANKRISNKENYSQLRSGSITCNKI